MAVFMLNICKFDDCGITFPSLADLILHIEDTHIDYDPAVIEQKEQQQPQSLPLSYVLKFYSNSARRESQIVDIKRRLIQHANKSSFQSFNSTHSEHDDEEPLTDSEDSNESWTTSEEFSSEYILKYGSKMMSPSSSLVNPDKPFVCPVPGCKKRYKNINGIKYHSKNGHKKDGKIRKGFKCHCGKSYKTAQGLKNHSSILHAHSITSSSENQSPHPAETSVRALLAKHGPGGSVVPLLKTLNAKQTELKTLETLKLKSIVENNNNKKIFVTATKVQPNSKVGAGDGALETDLGILTPATSPDSSSSLSLSGLSHLPRNTSNSSSSLEFHMNSDHCDNN